MCVLRKENYCKKAHDAYGGYGTYGNSKTAKEFMTSNGELSNESRQARENIACAYKQSC